MSDKSKTQFKKKSTGQKGRPWPDSVSFKREERSKVAGERRRASTVGQDHVKETQGRACRGAQGVPLGRPGANRRAGGASCFPGACRAGRVPLFAWQAGGVGGGGVWLVAKWGVLLVVGRQVVWGVPLGRGCCWSQARGVGGATGQGVLLVAGKRCGGATGQGVLLVTGKRCGGCHWAGGAAGRRQEVWGVPLGRGCCCMSSRGGGGGGQPFPHLFMLDALATLKEGCVCSCQCSLN